MADGAHVPVLLDEAVEALAIGPDGVYVDATFGRGGHARAILAALGPRDGWSRRPRSGGAEPRARRRRPALRVPPRAGSPSCPPCSPSLGIARVDGVLLDLGVSSPQIDDPARGFSFRFDGPLDMRMDPTRGESAAEFLARADGARTDGGHPRLW